MTRTTLTLAIPPKLKKEMKEFREVNWSEFVRQDLEARIRKLRLLRRFDELTKNSTLTEEDAIRIGREINKGISKRLGLIKEKS